MKLPGGTDICMCSKCKKVFNSTYAFDTHRTGTYMPDNRRCLTTEEMLSVGMDTNSFDRWVSKLRVKAVGEDTM